MIVVKFLKMEYILLADRQRDEYGNYTECTLFDSNGNEIRTLIREFIMWVLSRRF